MQHLLHQWHLLLRLVVQSAEESPWMAAHRALQARPQAWMGLPSAPDFIGDGGGVGWW